MIQGLMKFLTIFFLMVGVFFNHVISLIAKGTGSTLFSNCINLAQDILTRTNEWFLIQVKIVPYDSNLAVYLSTCLALDICSNLKYIMNQI